MKEDIEFNYFGDRDDIVYNIIKECYYRLCDEDPVFNAGVEYIYNGIKHFVQTSSLYRIEIYCNLYSSRDKTAVLKINQDGYKFFLSPEKFYYMLLDWWKEVKDKR